MALPLGGLNLAALASSAQAETGQRIAGQQDMLAATLQSMLQEQGGMHAGQQAQQGREQSFERAQAMLGEALALREQKMREAEQAARINFEASQGQLDRDFEMQQSAGQPDWYAQQRFQTDENIRQAKALAALQSQAEEAQAAPRLSDFGNSTINPYRGQALMGSKWGKKNRVKVGQKTREAAQDAIGNYGDDPAALMSELRKAYKDHGNRADEIASIALWQLGYGMGG